MDDTHTQPSQNTDAMIQLTTGHMDENAQQPLRGGTNSDESDIEAEERELNVKIKRAWKKGDKQASATFHRQKDELRRRKEELHATDDDTCVVLPLTTATDTATDEPHKSAAHPHAQPSHKLATTGGDSDDEDNVVVAIGEEQHKALGDYVKSIIYGGLDGIITTFAVVAGVQGADLKVEVILVLGFANLVADGLSMGVGDYLSEKAEMDFARSERSREKWEFDNYREGEIAEMVEIYENKGFSKGDAQLILTTMAKNPDFFIDHMMVQELDINPPDDDSNPVFNGLVTMTSFLIFGCVPLLSYVVLEAFEFDNYDPRFLVSILLTLFCLLILGGVKGKITESSMLTSALFVMLNGAAAAAASYAIGLGLAELTGIND